MEHESEPERLETKTRVDETFDQLRLVGCGPGLRVLDAGCGTAAVTRVIAEIVGPAGLAVGLDASAERLRHAARLAAGLEGFSLVCGDVSSLPCRSFDMVWSRFVLEYLPDPSAALRGYLEVVRPGGKVVIGDVDDHGLRHFPLDPIVAEGLERIDSALEGRFDPRMGRKLFHLMHSAGATDVRVHLLPYHVYAGRASDDDLENWRAKWDVIRPVVATAFGSADRYDRFVEAFMAMLAAEDTFTYSTLVLVEGSRAEQHGEPDR